jgi:hypothetical protein
LPPPVSAPSHQATLSCRAMAIDGEVRTDADGGTAAALAPRDEIPQGAWLSLATNARVVAKDPRTTRETTFRGPGRARACVDFLEESWLASGTFESTAGAGEAPGAEEWVVTPLGVVRFGAAKLAVDARPRGVRIRVEEGTVFLWVAHDASGAVSGASAAQSRGDASIDQATVHVAGGASDPGLDEGWVRIGAASATVSPAGSRGPVEAARSAVETCTGLAKSARDLATALLGGDADSVTAARHVTTRRLARAACGVAALRVEMLAPSDAKGSLSAAQKDAAGLWRSLPLLH